MPTIRRPMLSRALLLGALLLAPLAEAEPGTGSLPDTPAAQRLAEITALMADATPARVAAYVEANYAPEYAGFLPVDRRIGSFMDWKRRGGMTVVEVVDSQSDRIEVIAELPVTGERLRLGLEVESGNPHRVQRMFLGMMPLPPLDEALSTDEAAGQWLSYVDRLAENGLFSGAVLMARNGRILAQRAYGVANRDFDVPNDLETRFNLGSMNKTWTAVAIGQLVEAGKLAFDDPLAKFIDYPDADSAAKIRIEHLLTHTSGLGSYFTEEYDGTARKDMRTIDDFLALSADQPLAFEPGSDWQYSNTGMLVLGKVIEQASGMDYYDYVQAHILDRAGMTRSGCFELDRVNGKLAIGYEQRWTTDGPVWVNNLFEHVVRGGPAGGCYSTVGDLFRFATTLNDGTLVSSAMLETLTTAKPGIGSPNYGYGFGVDERRAVYGHSGGFVGISANLDITVDPTGWVIVVLANDDGAPAPMLKARQLVGLAGD